MSTRQRAMLDTTPEPVASGRLLVVPPEDAAAPPADIAALRLRTLAARLASMEGSPARTDAERPLSDADVEFEPVTLATVIALGALSRKPMRDALGTATAGERLTATPAPLADAALPTPESDAAEALPEAHPAPVLLLSEPSRPDESETLPALPAEADALPEAEPHRDVADATLPVVAYVHDEPLRLSDQSVPDLRLVDLIRRQQTLLEQLNRFPPLEDMPKTVAEPKPAPAETSPIFAIEHLAPPPPVAATKETPPPLPPERMALPAPPPSPAADREPADETSDILLPEQSPMIIQRAIAERTGRRLGPAVAAPPSAVPAFLAGLAAAIAIAGALFAVL